MLNETFRIVYCSNMKIKNAAVYFLHKNIYSKKCSNIRANFLDTTRLIFASCQAAKNRLRTEMTILVMVIIMNLLIVGLRNSRADNGQLYTT